MKNIVIIGNSAAGVTAAETIRQRDKDSRIVIVSDENAPAYQRYRILEILEGRAKEKDLVFRDNDFYRKNGLELFLDREVVSLQMVRKKVVFKDRETLDFDELVMATGAGVKLPELKGIHKEGVVALEGLRDIKFLRENLPLAHTVLIVGSDETALRLARLGALRKVDVKLFATLPEPVEGVEMIADNPIAEILGEGEARAVRLVSGKVIGASLIIFTGPREPRIAFLRDTEIEIDRGILVDEAMRTNIPHIYAAGDAAQPRGGTLGCGGWENAVRLGQLIRFPD